MQDTGLAYPGDVSISPNFTAALYSETLLTRTRPRFLGHEPNTLRNAGGAGPALRGLREAAGPDLAVPQGPAAQG